MKRLISLSMCCFASFSLIADSTEVQNIPVEQPQVFSTQISLKIDPLSAEQMQQGLSVDAIKEVIAKELDQSSISINEELALPALVLRVRTIKVGLDMATFFQLTFQEEAMLVRNRSMYHSITWSQSSVLACRPEDLKKESLETIATLVKSFAKDFKKAMQPKSGS